MDRKTSFCGLVLEFRIKLGGDKGSVVLRLSFNVTVKRTDNDFETESKYHYTLDCLCVILF